MGDGMWDNELTRLLNVEYPIIQAPMAGGVTSPDLIAAVSNSGGLGMMGAGYLAPGQVREQIRQIRKLTNKPFGINLFVPTEYTIDQQEINLVNHSMKHIKEKLNIQGEDIKIPSFEENLENFMEQIKVIIDEKVPICTFTFGIPSAKVLAQLKDISIIVLGTATTVDEAILNEKAGMDAVVLQGSEAGGHRGTFQGNSRESLIGLISLIPQATDHTHLPLIAAGGIMDGRGVMAAKCLGAKGVQMGTAFLTCEESGANQVYKDAILHTTEDQTVLTHAFSGKMARGIKNTFITEMEKSQLEIPLYPIQNELTKGIRKAAGALKNPEYMSLWSGQSPRLTKSITAKKLMEQIISEAEKVSSSLWD
jgi:nitronate monooxygenase